MARNQLTGIPLHARRSAASHPNTTPHVLELLAADPDNGVRFSVAAHPATPSSALQRLSTDAVERISVRARTAALARRLVG